MPRLRSYITVSFIFMLVLSFFGCSTEKDAALNVGYHNMTARYNGYFNARVIMQEALDNYRASANEDYTHLLPLDLYPTKEDIPSIEESSQKAQEKCEKVIQRHSMPSSSTRNKGEEHCRWIDDNWFVIGQLHYIRQEYVKAVDIFRFVAESPMYVDQERVHEARLWLAKSYIAQGRIPEAKRILSQVETDMEASVSSEDDEKVKLTKRQKQKERKQRKEDRKNGAKKPSPFPKELEDDYELTMAEFYIAQKDYKKAIPHLEKGIELTKKRKSRARYKFVLAQIHQLLGNGDDAAQLFNDVIQSSAPYEMRFQAQIQRALSATTGKDGIRKELLKMVKDPKNEEYKDQIYFALAEMEMNSGNKELAIQYYSQSVFYSIKNDRQKGVSYLKLGDIYFNDQDYLKAQKYYDSCVQVLPEEYETYEEIKGKAEGLSDLVFHYETYIYEDSIQKKAQMSPEELDRYLEKQLKDMREAEQKRKEEEQRRLEEQQNRIKNSTSNSGSGSKWYFYNTKVSSGGFNDFRALWGQRTLEDDWRRSNKTTFSFDSNSTDSTAGSDTSLVVLSADSLTVEMLKANLPLTPAAMDSSNNKLMNSLYMLGIIYKEQLKQDDEAMKYFGLVVDRKVEHNKVLPALYQLYLLNKKKGSTQSETYKNIILRDYAESEIAMILKDPDYLKKKQEKELEELNEYSETLENYRYQLYNRVIAKCNEIIEHDSDNQYINKYYLLKAFSIGKSNPGNSTLVREPLEQLYKIAPMSEEGMQAKVYLDKLEKGFDIVQPDTAKVEIPQSPYLYDEKVEHYFVLVFPEGGKVGPTETRISNFNSEFHKSKKLKVKTIVFGKDQLVVVQSFPEKGTGDTYIQSFESISAKTTLGKTAEDYQHFLISSDNFKELIKASDLQEYLDFYKTKYQ